MLDKLKKEEELDKIAEALLNDIISPDYTKTSKSFVNSVDGVGCDNMTLIIVKFKWRLNNN